VDPGTFSSVSLFLETGTSTSMVKKALARLGAQNVQDRGDNLSFELDGVSYEEVQKLFNEFLDNLCPTRRSQATVFENDDVHCLTAKNGQLLSS
jgi:hypothetical protein